MKNKRNNYTLTEILVVIIILAVVLAIALPGFNNMVNGNKTMRAAKQLATAFQQARAEAIVSGRKVALLFPVRRPYNSTITGIKANYSNASYGMLVYEADGDRLSMISEKNRNFKWYKLPAGTVISFFTDEDGYPGTQRIRFSENFSFNMYNAMENIDEINSIYTELGNHNFDSDSNNRLRAKLQYEFSRAFTSAACSIPAIVFFPDGTASASVKVFVTEGFVESSGALRATNINTDSNLSTELRRGRPYNSAGFSFNRFTGKVTYYEDSELL